YATCFKGFYPCDGQPRKNRVTVFSTLEVAVFHEVAFQSGPTGKFFRNIDDAGTRGILINFLKRYQIRFHLIDYRGKEIHINPTICCLPMVDVVGKYAEG